MNNVILLKMRPWVFLTELPLMILLSVCWRYSPKVENLLGLWPLMIALMALIVFLAFYFFRLVEISWEQIRDIGLFTRRDSSTVNAGKTLSLTLLHNGKLRIALLGKVGEEALFDWTSKEDAESEIALYRGNAYGGASALKKLLGYFGAAAEDLGAILGEGDFCARYAYSSVTATTRDEGREVRIAIEETLLSNGTPVKKKTAPKPEDESGEA